MKKLDSVKMMRQIRSELAKRYLKNPSLQEKELQAVREKYQMKRNKKKQPVPV